jgi:hypothetical protein
MKKLILSLVALAAVLILSAPVKAQYSGDPGTCNTQYADRGFQGYRGAGANGELVVRFRIIPHYTVSDPETLKNDFAAAMISEMNRDMVAKGSNVRFAAVDYDPNATGSSQDLNFNFTVWIDAYSTNSGYQFYTNVGGFAAGHLFRFHSIVSAEPADALIDVATGLGERLAFGWTCGTQN